MGPEKMHNATKNNQDDKVAKQREAIKNFRVNCSVHKDKKKTSAENLKSRKAWEDVF